MNGGEGFAEKILTAKVAKGARSSRRAREGRSKVAKGGRSSRRTRKGGEDRRITKKSWAQRGPQEKGGAEVLDSPQFEWRSEDVELKNLQPPKLET
ncbi:MAG: hypothetical protein DMG81_13635 [Acidobacteria bacterium]|nr:MAG: hypothetical protein DMG81_13635 [Acidobacteriota bacterium]